MYSSYRLIKYIVNIKGISRNIFLSKSFPEYIRIKSQKETIVSKIDSNKSLIFRIFDG